MSRRCKHVGCDAPIRRTLCCHIDKPAGSSLVEMHKHVDANGRSHAFCLIDMIVDSR